MSQRNGVKSGSEESLTLRRSKRRERKSAQEDPRAGGEGQAARVPSASGGESYSGDKTQKYGKSPIAAALPDLEKLQEMTDNPVVLPPEGASISDYKGISLATVGRDKRGRTIPHVRSEKIARQISVWVAGGADVNAICIRLNIRPGLLKECYGKELAAGLDMVAMDLTDSIYRRAQKSDRLAIFFAKARLGWRDGDGPVKDQSLLDIHIHL